MYDLGYLAQYALEHHLQSPQRNNIRRGPIANSGPRRSARLLSKKIRASRRHSG